MREIRFRGYDKVSSKGWVYGDLVHNQKVTKEGLEPRVMVGGYEVFEDSVGQYTGVRDISGNDIYEGDIVTFTKHGTHCMAAVEYNPCKMAYNISGCHDFEIIDTSYEKGQVG